jgi:phosphate-selective porin OprO and OprP
MLTSRSRRSVERVALIGAAILFVAAGVGAQPTLANPAAGTQESGGGAQPPGTEGRATTGTTPGSPTIEEQIHELDQQLRILKRQLELERERAAETATQRPIVAAGPEGFSVRSGDNAFQLRLRGYVQADGRFFLDDPQEVTPDSFVMRRVRPIVEATLYQRFDFRIMPDWGEARTVIQDAYLDLRFTPAVKVRAGKFKSPVGLERLVSATDLLFIERGAPTAVAPNRDIGVMVHGDVADAVVSYAVGLFNGVMDGGSTDTDEGDGKDVAIRLFAQPFRKRTNSQLAGLGVGVVGTVGKERGSLVSPALPVYRTTGQQVFFRLRADATAAGTTIADGDRWRAGVQGYYYLQSFGVVVEQLHSSQQLRRATIDGLLETTAWQVAGSYVLTGERATPRGVVPRRAFEPQAGAWGAIELTARYHTLEIGREVFPVFANPDSAAQRARAWTAGVNWYLSRAVKVTLDYEQSHFTGGSPTGDRQTSRDLFTRLQLAF